MCFFASSQRTQRTAPPKPEFDDSPPVVTGMQTGIENPKNTTKATEELKIKRQKKEGTYVDPNIAAVEEKLTRTGGGNKTEQQKKSLAANRAKAQNMASARLKRKFKTSPTGRKTGVA